MAYTPVGVGTVANDNTGDPIRTAFQTLNANWVTADARHANDSTIDIAVQTITGTAVDTAITITPNGTGNIVLGTMTLDSDQVMGAGLDGYALVYDNGTGLISLTLVATAAEGALAVTAVQIVTSTSAALLAIGNAINTGAAKVAGYSVWDATVDQMVWAVGAADGDVWVDGAGVTVHTPV